jgi:hypothetical protein
MNRIAYDRCKKRDPTVVEDLPPLGNTLIVRPWEKYDGEVYNKSHFLKATINASNESDGNDIVRGIDHSGTLTNGIISSSVLIVSAVIIVLAMCKRRQGATGVWRVVNTIDTRHHELSFNSRFWSDQQVSFNRNPSLVTLGETQRGSRSSTFTPTTATLSSPNHVSLASSVNTEPSPFGCDDTFIVTSSPTHRILSSSNLLALTLVGASSPRRKSGKLLPN